MYKCKSCDYQSPRSFNVQRHASTCKSGTNNRSHRVEVTPSSIDLTSPALFRVDFPPVRVPSQNLLNFLFKK